VPIVALLTDYGYVDTYVSEVKATILKHRPDARLIDITHGVARFSELEAAFLLKVASRSFPDGTVFICIVDPRVGTNRGSVVFETKRGNLYIGPDTGIMYPAARADGIRKVSSIDDSQLPKRFSETFHGRDVFAEVAGRIVSGKRLAGVLAETRRYTKLSLPEAKRSGHRIRAIVLHVDNFGNLVTNVHYNEIPPEIRGCSVRLGGRRFFAPLRQSYGYVGKGKAVLVVGGSGHLELAINLGNAAERYGAAVGDVVSLDCVPAERGR